MKGFTLDIFIFSRSIRKSENLMCRVSYLSVGPVQKPTAVLFNTDEGNFFPGKKIMIIIKILEKMLPGLFPICKYV